MAKTLAQIQAQIEQLQRKADALKAKEIAGVVDRIHDAIAHYGLTTEDLFGAHGVKRAGAKTGNPKAVARKATSRRVRAGVIRYRDSAGNAWTGMGPKPRWLQAALAAGQALEMFAVGASAHATPPKSNKPVLAAKYKDDAGHIWSGRGPRPRWLTEALASGKTLAQMAA